MDKVLWIFILSTNLDFPEIVVKTSYLILETPTDMFVDLLMIVVYCYYTIFIFLNKIIPYFSFCFCLVFIISDSPCNEIFVQNRDKYVTGTTQ